MAPAKHLPAYRPTLFDREGPDAGISLKAFAYALLAFGLSFPLFAVLNGMVGTPLHGWWAAAWVTACSAATGGICAATGLGITNVAAAAVKRFMMGGSTTPYKEQYSYQQALVMQGRVDDALESFEAILAEKPSEVDPRVMAAELYIREKQEHHRAAALFREIQRIPTVTPGEDLYATRRLVDLLTGPLDDPGRALVELRRLIDRYPGSLAAAQAREALVALKR